MSFAKEALKAAVDLIESEAKRIADIPEEDHVFELSEIEAKVGAVISPYIEALRESALTGEPPALPNEKDNYAPGLSSLAQAAVVTLAVRGDIVGQLFKAGEDALASEVKAFLDHKQQETKNIKNNKRKR